MEKFFNSEIITGIKLGGGGGLWNCQDYFWNRLADDMQ